MKKTFLLCFVTALVLLTGCGSSKETPLNSQPANNETATLDTSSNANANVDEANDADTTPEEETKTDERKLTDARNYIVSDIWNEGFVDIGSYISAGTSSTGQELDIEFTVQQLDKAMEKKPEYDDLMNELDSKFDSVKDIWSKLSGETDRLYKIVKENPPKAKDPNSNFDTGIFNQYMSAFNDEVREIAIP